MLDVTNTIIEYLTEEAVNDEQIDAILEEVLAWRREERKRKEELDSAREAALIKLREYYKAINACAGLTYSPEQLTSFIHKLEQDMRASEKDIPGLVKKEKPAAEKKEEDQILEKFIRSLMK